MTHHHDFDPDCEQCQYDETVIQGIQERNRRSFQDAYPDAEEVIRNRGKR